MRATVRQVSEWQAVLRARMGAAFAYLSDEWYLKLGDPVPEASDYDGLDLTENGVGAVRQFLDHADARLDTIEDGSASRTLVTGTLFASTLRRVVADLPRVSVEPVVNVFFGDTVSVAGLLTGQDVVAHLAATGSGGLVVLPPEMFGGPDGATLDGFRAMDVERALGRRVVTGEPPRIGVV
jgi:NifB/MoaA-like Fe-S oxidoreductase